MVEIFETQLRRSNGTLFWAKDSSRAAKDSRGNVLFYDGVIEDITRKKQMEEEHSWDVRLQASVGDVSERLLSPTPDRGDVGRRPGARPPADLERHRLRRPRRRSGPAGSSRRP